MIIDCISDTHGHYPKLEGDDLLIVAGDLTARDKPIEYGHFGCWLQRQKYKKKIIIAGNHDNYFQRKGFEFVKDIYGSINVDYLCDSGTEFDGLKIWGSPWSLLFEGINPECKAFTGSESDLKKKFDLIPDDIDILITHSPPYGILDWNYEGKNCGSKSLLAKVGLMETPPKLWVCGHIHEAYGEDLPIRQKSCKMVNASHVNEHYKPVNKPVRVIL